MALAMELAKAEDTPQVSEVDPLKIKAKYTRVKGKKAPGRKPGKKRGVLELDEPSGAVSDDEEYIDGEEQVPCASPTPEEIASNRDPCVGDSMKVLFMENGIRTW